VTAPDPLPAAVLVLRPFGSLVVTLVYAVLLVVLVVLGWGGLFIGLDHGFGAESGGADVVVLLLVVVVVGPILGGALGIATTLVASLVMLGGLALVRSLMPRYADTTLTHTVLSSNAVGPPRLTKGALSLLPTRGGRFADFALRSNLAAQGLGWRVLLACAWLGIADMVTAGWVRWPVSGPGAGLWAAVSLALVAVAGVSFAHARRHATRRTAGRPPLRRLGAGRLP
jgi:hypothetical protein